MKKTLGDATTRQRSRKRSGSSAQNRQMAVLLVLIFLGGFGNSVAHVFSPIYSITLGASGILLSMVFISYAVISMIFSYPGGVLADIWGRPAVLVLSAIALLLAATCYLLATSLSLLFVGQCLLGLFDAMFWSAAFTHVSDLASVESEARAQSRASAVFALGMVLGTASAGITTALFGLKGAFGLLAALALLALVVTFRIAQGHWSSIDLRNTGSVVWSSYRKGLEQLSSNRTLLHVCLVNIPGTWGWLMLGRTFYSEHLHLLAIPASTIGFLATARGVASIAGRLSFPLFSRYMGVEKTVLMGIVVGAVALSITPLAVSILALALAGCVGEGLEALRIPGTVLGATHSASAGDRALALSNVNLTASLGAAIGSGAMGIVAERTSLSVAFLLGGGAIAGIALSLACFNKSAGTI